MCTPWDIESLNFLSKLNIPGFKIASADLTNMSLIEAATAFGKPLILSTGMSLESEVRKTVDFLTHQNTDFAILHCNSTYPAPLHDINLNWLKKLKTIHPLVGYSGHERGIFVSIGAVALRAR